VPGGSIEHRSTTTAVAMIDLLLPRLQSIVVTARLPWQELSGAAPLRRRVRGPTPAGRPAPPGRGPTDFVDTLPGIGWMVGPGASGRAVR
jgi:hypothetical protein